jgi:DNA-binding GntR family transcriptional regulator
VLSTRELAQPRRESHSAKVYVVLRERIRKRELLPGDVLSENLLSREFSVSRTPIREAVQRLVQEGLLSVLPNRGIFVASLSISDVEEIYSIREVLEGLACSLAATRVSEAEVSRLDEIVRSAEAADAAGDIDQLTELDHQFHGGIAQASANTRLEAQLANMREADVLQQYGRHDERHRRRHEIPISEHRKVLEALRARDPEAAEHAIREHCRSAARFIAEYAFGAGPRQAKD